MKVNWTKVFVIGSLMSSFVVYLAIVKMGQKPNRETHQNKPEPTITKKSPSKYYRRPSSVSDKRIPSQPKIQTVQESKIIANQKTPYKIHWEEKIKKNLISRLPKKSSIKVSYEKKVNHRKWGQGHQVIIQTALPTGQKGEYRAIVTESGRVVKTWDRSYSYQGIIPQRNPAALKVHGTL